MLNGNSKIWFCFLLLLVGGLHACGVKRPPAPLYSLPKEAQFHNAEDATMAPSNGMAPILSPTPVPSFDLPAPTPGHK